MGLSLFLVAAMVYPSPAAASPATQASTSTAEELLRAGNDAYRASDWAAADQAFSRFLTEYGNNPQAVTAIATISPFLAMARIRQGRLTEALPVLESCLKQGKPGDPAREELAFWLGVCQMQAGKTDVARTTLLQFARSYPNSVRRNEALLLAGTVFVVQKKYSEAAEHFRTLLGTLQGLDRGRAVSLLLYSLIASDRLDDALSLVTTESGRMNEILQIAGFQLLALELGSKFLEAGEQRKAIAAFQRVWPRERVIQTQESRLQYLKNRRAALEAQHAAPDWTFQLSQSITKIERELATFREMKNYDSGLRLRLASAFLGMERYREAALVLEAMLQQMEPDPIVEKASISLMQCWLAVERWPKAIEAAVLFEKKFPDSEQLPMALLLKGQAEQSGGHYTESVETFRALAKWFPKSELVPRALFMAGFGELLQEHYAAAGKAFDEVCSEYAKDPMADAAGYWGGMALSMDRKFPEAREALEIYLRKHKSGQFVGAAAFRKAYCAHSNRDYATSVAELKAFLREHAKNEHANEVLLLLGDAYLAQGEIDRGIDTYKRIPSESTRCYEEGWFKIGKALRVEEKFSSLRAHMQQFCDEHAKSARMPEAIYWIGWSYRQEGKLDNARKVYWDAIEKLGDQPENFAVEDLFAGLAKLYSAEELKPKLEQAYQEAASRKRNTLAMRAQWALASVVRKQNPEEALKTLLAVDTRADVSTTSPRLLADFAEAREKVGDSEKAAAFYRGLLKWNPRSNQKDRALAGLGRIAVTKGDTQEAVKYFDRFLKEAPDSLVAGEIQLARARIYLGQNEVDEARACCESVLASKQTNSRAKAEALLGVGDILLSKGEYGQAIAYFQRVYVMYNRSPVFVAKAYLQSGAAFEKLDDLESAVRTYREMIERPELVSLDEIELAKKRLAALEAKASTL